MDEGIESRVLGQKERLTDADFLVMKIIGILVIGAATILGTYATYEFLCSKSFEEIKQQAQDYFSPKHRYIR